MTSEVLAALVRANLAASVAVLVVLALRTPVARRLGARAAYALWIAAPLAGVASLIPARVITLHRAAVSVGQMATAAPAAPASGVVALGHVTSDLFGTSPGALATVVWAFGAGLWAAAVLWRQHRFNRTLGPLRREADIYRAQATGLGPMLLGALRPRIVVPADFEARFTAEERVVVLAHEQAHLRAGDHLVNVAVAAAQALCWFNPLAHIAARHLRVDQELACDAAVLARHPHARRTYGEAMLKTQSAGFAAPLACQWPAVGPSPLKRRIAMLKARAPSAPRRLAGLTLAAAFSLGAGVAAWAAQPARVHIVQASSPPNAAPGWESERHDEGRHAEARHTPLALGRDLASHNRSRLDRDLLDAVLVGDDRAAQELLAAGADVNAKFLGDGSPLIVAAREGRVEIAERLVAGGADVNGFVLFDETPLVNAARAGQLPMVKFLLAHAADPNLAVPSGNGIGDMRSPLGMARDPQIAAYLRSHGARG